MSPRRTSDVTGRSWTVPALRQRCRTLREALAPRVSAEDLAAVWPGGVDNAERGLGGWIECYAQLVRLAGSERPAAARAPAADDARLRRIVAQSLADVPEMVTLSDGSSHAVYAKSYRTHEVLQDLDLEIRLLAACDLTAAAAGAACGVDVPLYGLQADAVAVWAWNVTTPGGDLPFDETRPTPAPPAWTRTLSAGDLLALAQAFARVDGESLAIMSAAFPRVRGSDDAPSRLAFAGFLGAFVADKGLDPLAVTRTWALRRVVAVAVSEATAQDEARRRADTDRARGTL